MAESYDLIVIGGGPGGYVATIRAAQLGFKTACVEKRGTLGGTCLNVGCIPSKALLHNSRLYAEATHELKERGIEVGQVKLNLKKLMGNKDKIVGDLTKGVEFLFKKNKIDHLQGTASIEEPGKVIVAQGKKKETYETKNILIATGSDSAPLLGVEVDEKQVVTSTGALSLPKIPKHLVVIGGGVIGLELGSVWARFGAKVTVVEYLDRILPTNDGEVSKQFQAILQKQGINFRLSTQVMGVKKARNGVIVTVRPVVGGPAETIKADVALLSIGRVPYTEGLGLDKVGVKTDAHGFIQVDPQFKTNVSGIYAIGDCISGPMLAHKAEDEGVVVAEILAGQSGHIDYDAIPGIVYTWPEVASVGKTEEELKEAGRDYKSGKFPFIANSRARCTGDTEGFVKILADAQTDEVLGCHIIGADAGNLIQEIVTVIEFGGSAEDVARTCHGHPTMTEALKEAALTIAGRPIHI